MRKVIEEIFLRPRRDLPVVEPGAAKRIEQELRMTKLIERARDLDVLIDVVDPRRDN